MEDVHHRVHRALRGYRTRHQRRPDHRDDRRVHRPDLRGTLLGRLRVEVHRRRPQDGRPRSHLGLRDVLRQIRDAPLPHRVHPGGLGGQRRGDHREAAGSAGRSSSAVDAATGAAGWAYPMSSSAAWPAAWLCAVRKGHRSAVADRSAGSGRKAERSTLGAVVRPLRQWDGPTQGLVEGRWAPQDAARSDVRGLRRGWSPGGGPARSPAERPGDRN